MAEFDKFSWGDKPTPNCFHSNDWNHEIFYGLEQLGTDLNMFMELIWASLCIESKLQNEQSY